MRIEDEKLDQKFGDLALREISEGILESRKRSFEDKELFEAKLPTVSMMLQGLDYTHVSLSKFLMDLATDMARES